MPFAFFGLCIQAMFLESPEDFPDMFHMLLGVIGVNQDIVKVDYYALI